MTSRRCDRPVPPPANSAFPDTARPFRSSAGSDTRVSPVAGPARFAGSDTVHTQRDIPHNRLRYNILQMETGLSCEIHTNSVMTKMIEIES
jgi:hypothetical protein